MNKKMFPALLLAIMVVFSPMAFACDVVEDCIPGDGTLEINKTAKETGNLTANVTLEMTGTDETRQTPAGVVFAIDSSGSMTSNDKNGLRKDSVKNFMDKMNSSKDKVGVVNWDDKIQSSIGLTDDFALAKKKVDDGVASGYTNGGLAIEKSIEILDKDSSLLASQKFIILLTDGQFNRPSGNANPYALAQADDAKNKGYKIFTIGLGNGVEDAVLKDIANKTGGNYYFASDATVLNAIYDQIFKDITTAATNLVVTDIITSNFTYINGSATITPNSIQVGADNTTTLTWEIPQLSASENWSVTYSILSKIYGENIPTNIEAKVNYIDPKGCSVEQLFPVPTVTFVKPPEPEPTPDPEPEPIPEPIIEPADEPAPAEEEQTIPMEKTGYEMSSFFLVIAILLVVGFLSFRTKKE